MAEGSPTGRALARWHDTLPWILVGLIAAHVLAAFIHLLVYRDRVMQRMLPGMPPI